MDWITNILAIPIGLIMRLFYLLIPNYAVALLLITIVSRLVLLPSSIKQQRNSAKMAEIQKKIRAVQAQYRTNREKMNEEMNKIYQAEGYNPMSGCLSLLITWPLFFGVIGVVYKPLTYLLRLDSGLIAQATAAASGVTASPAAERMMELFVVKYENLGFIKSIFPNGTGLNLSFFGLDLTQTPSINHFDMLWIIPILAGLAQFATLYITQKATGQKSNFIMSILFPLISVWMTFSFPAAVGLYWVYSAVIAGVQSYLIHKFYHPSLITARNLLAAAKRRQQKFSA